jgi:chorismate mutase
MRERSAMTTKPDAGIAALSDEIRRYPTPIARCDEQLAELLERRARLLAETGRIAAHAASPGCSPDSVWINDGGFNAV